MTFTQAVKINSMGGFVCQICFCLFYWRRHACWDHVLKYHYSKLE